MSNKDLIESDNESDNNSKESKATYGRLHYCLDYDFQKGEVRKTN